MTEQTVIDFEAASARRNAGIESSTDHAELEHPGWADHAFGLLCVFAGRQSQPWTIEQFREWGAAHGLAEPPELRAFGGVTLRAIKRGVIVKVGYAPTASSNGSPKATYAAAVRAAG